MSKIIDNYVLMQVIANNEEKEYQIFKAKHVHSKVQAIVKAIPLNIFMHDQQLRDHYINEIQLLKKLDHPSVIKLYKMLKSSNNFYIIYEYIPYARLY